MTPQQQQQFIVEARKRGYSPQQIEAYLEAKDNPKPPQAPQKQAGLNFVGRLKESAKQGINKIKSSSADINSGNPLRFIEGSLRATAGAVETAFSPVTAAVEPVLKPTLGRAVNYAADKISDNKNVQNFADSKAGHITSRVVEDVNNLNTIAGAVAGSKTLMRTGPRISGVVDATGELSNMAKSGASNAIDTITSTLDEGTKSVLNPRRRIPKDILPEATERITKNITKIETRQVAVQERLNKYIKQAQKAVQDYSQETPLELAGRKAEEALRIIDDKLAKHGGLKSKSLETVGKLKLNNVSEVRNILRDTLIDRTGTGISTKGKLVQVAGRKSSIPDADLPLVQKVEQRLRSLGSKPTVREVDDTIDYIQSELYKRQGVGAVPVDNKVVSTLKQVTGELNKRVKKVAGKSYQTANSKYSYFIDTREALNKALGSEATKGGSLMKRVFSPTDGGTKRLFAEIKKLTGIDLTEEATLAKFAMEKVGDARQASLLEQLQLLKPQGAMGMLENAGKFLIEKAKDPIKEASRIIEQGKLPRP